VEYLLDCDTFSNLTRGNVLIAKQIMANYSHVWLSIIAAREKLKGAMASVGESENPNLGKSGALAIDLIAL
jgi:hypothetical protein